MLTQASIEVISRQAITEYPSECCGIVTGSVSAQRVHYCKNRQDVLHARDPEHHPRTSREAYDIDRNEMERIFADAAVNGEQVIAFYHSHIDCGAYFSKMDKDVQTVFGEPEFTGAVHVVVSVKDLKVMEISGFLWDGKMQDFVQVAVT